MTSKATPTWRVEVDDRARRELRRLDRPVQKRILGFLRSRIATAEDPRRMGIALTGRGLGLWRYRVGSYRAICQIADRERTVLVLRIRHRSTVYRSPS